MARKAIVNRDTVLQLLREGQTSQSIASQFGVSRQAIDLHRKQFVREGRLESRAIYQATPPAPLKPAPRPVTATPPEVPRSQPALPPQPANISLDQMIDLLIKAFDALKRVPELETELADLHRSYAEAKAQVEQLQSREQKRKEQEARWIHAQQPGIVDVTQD